MNSFCFQSDTQYRRLSHGTVLRWHTGGGVPNTGRHLLANILLRGQHIGVLHRSVWRSARPVHRHRQASDEQSRNHVARQPQQRAQIPQTGDIHVGRGGPELLHMPSAISSVHTVDYSRTARDHPKSGSRWVLHPAVLLPCHALP